MFNNEELSLIRRIANGIIPPQPDCALPGADDNVIFDRLITNAVGHENVLQRELHDLLKAEGGVSSLSACDEVKFEKWMSGWAEGWPDTSHPFFKHFLPLLLRAYYQDSRIHEAYDRRPGPPFPKGYEIIEGDWSLLDPVRERAPFYRT